MKKWIIIGVVLVVIFSLYGTVKGIYNSMVAGDEMVKNAWAQVENVLQRRFDLIPNLVETVKGYASHEEEVLTAHTLLAVGRTLIKEGDLDGAEKVIVQGAEELRDCGEFGLSAKRVYKELLAARGGKWAKEHPDHPWLDIT